MTKAYYFAPKAYCRSSPALWVLFFFAAGIAVSCYLSLPGKIIAVCILVYLFWYLASQRSSIIYLLFFLIGAWRFTCWQHLPVNFSEGLTKIQGIVVEENFPDHWSEQPGNRFKIKLKSVQQAKSKQIAPSCYILVCCNGVNVRRGDLVEITGRITPGAWNFRARKIDYIMMAPASAVTILSIDNGCPVLNFFSTLRRKYIRVLHRHFGNKMGNFLAALVLGARSLLPQESGVQLQKTGLGHVMAISGLHISMVVMLVALALKSFGVTFFLGSVILMLFSTCYCLLSGMQPSVVRATIMIILYLLAPFFGKKACPINCLSISAVIMLEYNPALLILPGFQLSFAACFAILHAIDIQPRHSLLFWLVHSIKISTIAFLATMPLQAYYFYAICPLAPLATVLVMPAITVLFAGCFLLLFTPLGIGSWSVFPVYCVQYTCSAVDHFLSLSVTLSPRISLLPSLVPALVFHYVIMIWFRPKKWLVQMVLLIITMISGYSRNAAYFPSQAVALNVGHGTAIYIHLPENKHILYDCGSNRYRSGQRTIIPFLKMRGINKLDALIISHYDKDHYSALASIAQNIVIKRIIVNKTLAEHGVKIHTIAKQYNIPIIVVGNRRILPQLPSITFYDPGLAIPYSHKDNDHSLSALIQFDSGKMLLTGDLENKGIIQLLSEGLPKIDILQAPHHGSFIKNSEKMLQILRPKATFFSGNSHSTADATLSQYKEIPLFFTYNGPVKINFASGKIIIDDSKNRQKFISRF